MPSALMEGLTYVFIGKCPIYCKIIASSILRTSHLISGRVDATRCSKLTGGYPPVPPALTEGLKVKHMLNLFENDFNMHA